MGDHGQVYIDELLRWLSSRLLTIIKFKANIGSILLIIVFSDVFGALLLCFHDLFLKLLLIIIFKS